MWFLAQLGETALAAAIGYAGAILFFTTSVNIGLMIALTARVSRAFGANDDSAARRSTTHATIVAIAVGAPGGLAAAALTPVLLDLLGAAGEAKALATSYLRIILPSMPVFGVAMALSGALRAASAPKAAMGVTIAAGAVNLILDPIFIFSFGWGVDGAAWASVAGRFAALGWAVYTALYLRDLAARSDVKALRAELPAIFKIAGPAMATNVATPVATAIVTAQIAVFGDGAVAGFAVIARVQPVAFALVFALSGAIGPIIGQNAGAGRPDRVRRTLRDALLTVFSVVALVWAALALSADAIAAAFQLSGDAAALFTFFCLWTAPGFAFAGAQFASNATFNNLEKPHWSTIANWTKATLVTVPLVAIGATLGGAPGALAGEAIGSVLCGGVATAFAYRLTTLKT